MPLIALGIVLVVIGLYVIGVYNTLQVTLTRIQAAYQEIGSQLKRQASLIPNLMESTKGYMAHEKGIFNGLTQAREAILTAAKDSTKLTSATDALEKVMPQLLAVFESNPQLKANEVVAKLMDELRDTSDKLLYARRGLISLTAEYNAKLVTFPSNLITSIFGFKTQPGIDAPTSGSHLAVSAAETQDIKIQL